MQKHSAISWITMVTLLWCASCGDPSATNQAAPSPCGMRPAADSIRGQVAVASCTEVVPGATVTLWDELLRNELGRKQTNSEGEFILPLPAQGRYILTASKGAYSGTSEVFTVDGQCPYQVVVLR